MSFAAHLRPLVEQVGGATAAAEICGVSRQIVNLWLRGEGRPNRATQAGAMLLLARGANEAASQLGPFARPFVRPERPARQVRPRTGSSARKGQRRPAGKNARKRRG